MCCAGVLDGAELCVPDGAELWGMLCCVLELRTVQSYVMCYAGVEDGAELCDVLCRS